MADDDITDIAGIPIIRDDRVEPGTFYLGVFHEPLPDDFPNDVGPAIRFDETAHLTIPNPRATPQWVDLYGIDPDYTDGIPTEQWLDTNHGDT